MQTRPWVLSHSLSLSLSDRRRQKPAAQLRCVAEWREEEERKRGNPDARKTGRPLPRLACLSLAACRLLRGFAVSRHSAAHWTWANRDPQLWFGRGNGPWRVPRHLLMRLPLTTEAGHGTPWWGERLSLDPGGRSHPGLHASRGGPPRCSDQPSKYTDVVPLFCSRLTLCNKPRGGPFSALPWCFCVTGDLHRPWRFSAGSNLVHPLALQQPRHSLALGPGAVKDR
ncbi:hypothetical protein GQ53DRAFT_371950 [Thozetella sp. PMI_491]|nr:hypothetical protein GQ53DRAFT_371950 [Thozetella sp. PMI_491]